MASRKRTEPVQDDLFNPEVELLLPARLAIEGKALGSPIRQLAAPPQRVRCRLRAFSIRRVTGHETTLPSGEILKIINAKTATSLEAELILLVPGASEPAQIVEALDAGEGRWMAPLPIRIDTLSRQARFRHLGRAPFISARDEQPKTSGQPSSVCDVLKSAHCTRLWPMRRDRSIRPPSSCRRAPARRKPCSRSTSTSASRGYWS